LREDSHAGEGSYDADLLLSNLADLNKKLLSARKTSVRLSALSDMG
jgi:hypothetical protein